MPSAGMRHHLPVAQDLADACGSRGPSRIVSHTAQANRSAFMTRQPVVGHEQHPVATVDVDLGPVGGRDDGRGALRHLGLAGPHVAWRGPGGQQADERHCEHRAQAGDRADRRTPGRAVGRPTSTPGTMRNMPPASFVCPMLVVEL